MSKIICGFSGNPAEHLFLDGGTGDKRKVTHEKEEIEGSTINVCSALRHFGFKGEIVAMVLVGGQPHEDTGRFLFNKLGGRLTRRRIRLHELDVLNKCNRARVVIHPDGSSDHKILGTKGEVIANRIKSACGEIRSEMDDAAVAILTSLRPQEMPFAKVVSSAIGPRRIIMSLHGDALRSPGKILNTFLEMGSVLVMNRAEYTVLEDRGWNFARLHKAGKEKGHGPELIVVTDGERDGLFSLRGQLGDFPVQSVRTKCTDGAGDRLIAVLAEQVVSGARVLSNARFCKTALSDGAVKVGHTLRRTPDLS